jgi:hypothetical protein
MVKKYKQYLSVSIIIMVRTTLPQSGRSDAEGDDQHREYNSMSADTHSEMQSQKNGQHITDQELINNEIDRQHKMADLELSSAILDHKEKFTKEMNEIKVKLIKEDLEEDERDRYDKQISDTSPQLRNVSFLGTDYNHDNIGS